MNVVIDPNAGFCSGVRNAIHLVEQELRKTGHIYCLGDIVHNKEEVARLERKGMKTISHQDLHNLKNATVLIRAHGEPPLTYAIAKEKNIRLIDGTCAIVSKLQDKLKTCYDEIIDEDGQIVIFGKKEHPEVDGLLGQTGGKAIVINDLEDLDQLDYRRPVYLFSQTTKNKNEYQAIQDELKTRIKHHNSDSMIHLMAHQTICSQVANRAPQLARFAGEHDAIIFVSGKESSNGKTLFDVCKKHNSRSFFISEPGELKLAEIKDLSSIGISGATSTPIWLLEKVAKKISYETS